MENSKRWEWFFLFPIVLILSAILIFAVGSMTPTPKMDACNELGGVFHSRGPYGGISACELPDGSLVNPLTYREKGEDD